MGKLEWLFRACIALLLGLWTCAGHAEEWLPVNPEELAMKAEPLAPKASAIYLYHQVDRNDEISVVRVYNRIKILSEEGRDKANVKIAFDKNRQSVRNIEARTIRPDGSIVDFTGKPYDQVLAKGRGMNSMAKLFTLSDVQVGSIIEYRYTLQMDSRYVFDSYWELNQDLFTKHARYSLVQNSYYSLRWSWPLGLPPGTNPPEKAGGKIQMEVRNVPAFAEEDYMPPDSAVKMHVAFIYLGDDFRMSDADKFWNKYGSLLYKQFNTFIGKPSAMQELVSTIVNAEDAPEVKARKLYTWVQKLRNLSFERRRSDEEQSREDLKTNRTAKDLIKNGYGWGDDLNWLYVALARSAGLQADAINVPSRSSSFFSPKFMNPNQLNTYVVRLNFGGAYVFVDPGTAFVPYGVLPWHETMVVGMLLNDKGGEWVNTPAPVPSQARIERRANLQLDASGSLQGKLVVTYHGLSALTLRLNNRFGDATERKEVLEDMIERYIPVGIDVTLINEPDWSSSEPTLTAEFDLKVPGWLQSAGSRRLLPLALLGAETRHIFNNASRTHPIYFEYPYVTEDEVAVKLPDGVQHGTLPMPNIEGQQQLIYNLKVEAQNDSLKVYRKLQQPYVILKAGDYSFMREFFQKVRSSDEQQILLTSAPKAAVAKQ